MSHTCEKRGKEGGLGRKSPRLWCNKEKVSTRPIENKQRLKESANEQKRPSSSCTTVLSDSVGAVWGKCSFSVNVRGAPKVLLRKQLCDSMAPADLVTFS